jgi:uncharacterized protein (TIGR02118 family)
MRRIVSLHGHPDDPVAFDDYYRNTHTPLVQRIPGVSKVRFGRVLPMADGTQAPFYVVSDVYFEDDAAFEAAQDSPEMAAALADVPRFATGGVTIMLCDYEDFPPIAGGPPGTPPER